MLLVYQWKVLCFVQQFAMVYTYKFQNICSFIVEVGETNDRFVEDSADIIRQCLVDKVSLIMIICKAKAACFF